MKPTLKIISSVLVFIFTIVFAVGTLHQGKSSAAVTATFALSPSSGSYEVGQTFSVNVLLDTAGNATDGAAVRNINYDTSLLEVQDANASQTGVQVQAGSLYTNTQQNSVSSGQIIVSQTSAGGTTYTGSGTFVTISFQVLAAGTANVTIDYTAGSTSDSNVSGGDEGDILSGVTNASFTLTQPVDTTAPTISSVSSSSVTTSGATISWTTNEASTSQVEYGISASYGSSTTADTTQATSHSVTISGLGASTAYHYRVKSQDAVGNLATSGDYTFTTSTPADTTAPLITGTTVSAKDQSAAVIIWTTSEASTSQVEYGTSDNYGSSTTLDTSLVTSHQVSIGGLNASTAYHYRVKSQDVAGNLATTGDSSFTTDSAPAPDTTPPTISDVRVISKDSSAAVIGWSTDEMSTSQVEYGASDTYGSSTTLNENRVLNHEVAIGGLAANTTYNYRVVSKDGSGNEKKSSNNTFTTNASNVDTTDNTAPSAVSDLLASEVADTSVILTWTAVGDDTSVGQASGYEIRYSTTSITNKNWSKATKVSDVPTPSLSGTKEKATIKNLKQETTYYFAIKVSDEKPNTSVLSNVVKTTTKKTGEVVVDITPPAKALSAISSIDKEKKSITLTWSNPQDDDFAKVVVVRKQDQEPQTKDDGVVVYEGNANSFIDTDVLLDGIYYYKIFALDEVPNYSEGVALSASLSSSSQIQIDTVAPDMPKNFDAQQKNGLVSLSWTNPTSDDFDSVVVRRAETSTPPKNYYNALIVYKGKDQSVTDNSVEKGKTYYYAIFSVDKDSNYSKPAVTSVTTTNSGGIGFILGIIIFIFLMLGGAGYWWFIYRKERIVN